jgi:signal transduction histidine kinase
MEATDNTYRDNTERLPLNIAIVGGGRACKFFLELLEGNAFPYLNIRLKGVCDINPQAEGFLIARQKGVFTTCNYRDLFQIKDLDSIIELTNSKEVLLELIKARPKGVGIVEHNISRFLRSFFEINQKLKSAEQQALLEKMSSDFLIQQSNAAIAVLNTDFTIDDMNEAYLKMVDKTKDQAIGRYCYEVHYGLESPCASAHPMMKCPMLETLTTGKSAHVIQEFSKRGDKSVYDNIVTYPLMDQSGKIHKVIEIWRDITEEINSQWEGRAKELKADLNKMVQEDRMISLGKLVASCVHEINNPIQGLLTFSDLMQEILDEGTPDAADIDQFRQYLHLMSTELVRCGDIVSGLLSFSREAPLEYKNLNINDVLEAVITLTRHKMELQNIELVTDLAAGIISVHGDANRLQQVLLNLIFNAIEAMPQGGRLDITSKLSDDGQSIVITVRDTGCGIPSSDMNHLFDPFFTTKAEGEGTGLGLSIAYGVVKNHGGHIQVQSTVGAGTEFLLSLPTN